MAIINGTNGKDLLYDTNADDELFGYDGDDFLFAINRGNNIVHGGDGNDVAQGGAGNDRLFGDDGDDVLAGFAGSDLLVGGSGSDSIDGGLGDDMLVGGPGSDYMRGDLGDDTYLIDDLTDRIVEIPEGGIDTAIISFDGSRFQQRSNIENVTYLNDSLPLAYWVDAVVENDLSLGVPAHKNVLSFAFATDQMPTNLDGVTLKAFSVAEQSRAVDALNAWSSMTNLSFVPASSPETADLVLGYNKGAAGGLAWTLPGGGWAATVPSTSGLTFADPFLFSTLLHEIGHALRLGHAGDYPAGSGELGPFLPATEDSRSNTVMSYRLEANISPDTLLHLQAFDIAAAQFLYGVNPSVRSGDTSYKYLSLAWPDSLISDGQGADTIDASDVAAQPAGFDGFDMTIDLRSGGRIFAGVPQPLITASGQASINYGTVIENAIGSSGRDRIVGNPASNRLIGGPGNDYISGGGGDDDLDGGSGDDVVDGGSGSNFLRGGPGNDIFTVRAPLQGDIPAEVTLNTVLGQEGNDELIIEVSQDFSFTYSDAVALHALLSRPQVPGTSSMLGTSWTGIERATLQSIDGKALPNWSPIGQNSSETILEDFVFKSSVPTAIDIGGGSLTYELVNAVRFGSLTLGANGEFEYSPFSNFSGDDNFTYVVKDNSGLANTYSVSLVVQSVVDSFEGTDRNDSFGAYPGGDRYSGGMGNDVFTGGGGDDVIDGGAGIDRARYAGNRANYIISKQDGGFLVQDGKGNEGSDHLSQVERLSFATYSLALDLDGNAGIVAKILGALFGGQFLSNKVYVGLGLDLLDRGMSYGDLVSLAVQSDLFVNLAGSRGNTAFVRLVYKNVVGVDAPQAELAYLVGLLDSGTHSQSSLAFFACETEANTQKIDLVGLASTGIEYLPVGG